MELPPTNAAAAAGSSSTKTTTNSSSSNSSSSSGVILYGQSVGSGPTCYLASKRMCAGVVLHSPIMSGMRVLTVRCKGSYSFAIFNVVSHNHV